MGWFSKHFRHDSEPSEPSDLPPEWTAAPESSRTYGLYDEAPKKEYEAAEEFCERKPPNPPRLLSSADVDLINREGAKAWGLIHPTLSRFKGRIRDICADLKGAPKVVELETLKGCGDTCVFSNYPLMAGLYDIRGKNGIYYETTILHMDGVIAIGLACKPYPEYRLPGWNRLSVGLHLDDLHKFYEDPNGGRPYTGFPSDVTIKEGDTVGCGYEFDTGSVFFTYNGIRLPNAFQGTFLPRQSYDVYAVIGVGGKNKIKVNFGGDNVDNLIRWGPGREWAWLVEGHVGCMTRSNDGYDEDLPTYSPTF